MKNVHGIECILKKRFVYASIISYYHFFFKLIISCHHIVDELWYKWFYYVLAPFMVTDSTTVWKQQDTIDAYEWIDIS